MKWGRIAVVLAVASMGQAADAQRYYARSVVKKAEGEPAPAAPPLVVNGDMSASTGWALSNAAYYVDGTKRGLSVNSNGNTPGTASQTIAVKSGMAYTLTYALTLRNGSYCSYPGGVTVTSGGGSASDVAVFCGPGASRTVKFTAAASTATIVFSSGAQYGQYASMLSIDDVVVTQG